MRHAEGLVDNAGSSSGYERRGGSCRARRANSDFHHRNDDSAIPRSSAKARAERPLDSHAATRSAHFAALSLMLMRVRVRCPRHPRKAAASSSGYRRSPGPRLPGERSVALARVVRDGEPPPVALSSSLVVIVGSARIVVERDFDPSHLRAVVRVLGDAT